MISKMMTVKTLCLLGAFILPAPFAAADNIADCEVLIAERIEDEATGGSALISSYRPAAAFISSVYDEDPGHIREIDGHKIRALLCQRRRAIPTLRDYPLLETGIPLTLSQNFDSALSDVVIVQFKDGAFQSTYTGPGLSRDEAAELEDVIDVFNLQPNNLAAREAAQKKDASPLKGEADIVSGAEEQTVSEAGLNAYSERADNEAAIEIITLEPEAVEAPETKPDDGLSDEGLIESPKENLQAGDAASPAASENEPPLKPGPLVIEDSAGLDICRIIGRDALGQIQELPISAQGLQDTLETAPIFVFPTPPGLNLRAVKCKRDTLTPRANDYKVARAGYPFFYQVDGDDKRVAALEFAGDKFRMNLLEGDFTSQELIDAKARILSFNDQHVKDLKQQKKETP